MRLNVELADQIAVQGQLGHRADPEACNGQHDGLTDQQPNPK